MDQPEMWPYAGNGQTLSERNDLLPGMPPIEVPPYDENTLAESAADYEAGEGLRAAVNVALILGQPLLLTGDPGTGKTQLAWSVARELELPFGHRGNEEGGYGRSDGPRNEPFVFHTKTTSAAKDLFYRYDALRHFQDIHLTVQRPVEKYITFEALGKAILLAADSDLARDFLPARAWVEGGARSVVLIDEVDKAPRDFPNDLLNEIEEMAFEVKELERVFVAEKSRRPIVILTSNSEKNLPDAFLRRCVFYHITFPTEVDDLKRIVDRRLKVLTLPEEVVGKAIEHFLAIRKVEMKKRPATAELLIWLRLLEELQLDVTDQNKKDLVVMTYAILAKNRQDHEAIVKKMWS
jgi:MoxR-like ATPase